MSKRLELSNKLSEALRWCVLNLKSLMSLFSCRCGVNLEMFQPLFVSDRFREVQWSCRLIEMLVECDCARHLFTYEKHILGDCS